MAGIDTDTVGSRVVHADIALQGYAHGKDFRGKCAGAKDVIARRERMAKEVQAVGDRGGEFKDQAWHRQVIAGIDAQAMTAHIRIIQKIVPAGEVQNILPIGITIGARGETEMFRAQRDRGACACCRI